jgi:Mycolic acid cyclopropane synthetase
LRITFWGEEVFEFAAKPRVTITLCTLRLMRYLLTGHIARLGRAYAEGEIDVEGRLQDVLQIGIALSRAARQVLTVARRGLDWRVGAVATPWPAMRRCSNEFYRLWLDRNMVYSYAYFGFAPTLPVTCRLLQWARRLEAERDKTIKAAGVQRYRIWRMYMPAMAYGFDRGWLSVYQVLAQKPCGWIATAAVDALLPVFASRTRTAHRGPGLGRSLTCCNEDAGRLPGTP